MVVGICNQTVLKNVLKANNNYIITNNEFLSKHFLKNMRYKFYKSKKITFFYKNTKNDIKRIFKKCRQDID